MAGFCAARFELTADPMAPRPVDVAPAVIVRTRALGTRVFIDFEVTPQDVKPVAAASSLKILKVEVICCVLVYPVPVFSTQYADS